MKIFVVPLLLLANLSLPAKGQQAIDSSRYIFFLHNKFVEEHGPLEKHPSYGRAEYKEILGHFTNDGFVVISEKRKPNTDVKIYAEKAAAQIDSLLHAGINPSRITVVGTSKGGYIAQYVSSLMKNKQLNFVFIGSSFKNDLDDDDNIRLYGRMLSITEASDTGNIPLSTQPRCKNSSFASLKEITLHTNLHHGFLFKALDLWIDPTEKWARFQIINR
ncbi:alpha/beta hydrolase [Dinghuibacter silviterrae]|uniref:Alpha/beta hydrolase n=1 Tax=Dinghuibacter silviterrae TaxID=1539049 RepID=A0A4V3GM54_9BACT|nr:alpha/beta hydrolase [Dinghuibacter silviterrae]TDX02163.1 hypothetical protein EDB95_3213 [Dinghuibacter silviterrae]